MTIYTLKMQSFIDTMFNEIKPEWWDDVYDEYINRRANDDTRYILGLMKEVMYLQNQYFICSNIITNLRSIVELCTSDDVLKEVLSETTLIKELKDKGVVGYFDISNKSSMTADLNRAGSYIKRMKSQIRLREKDIEDFNNKNAGKEITREWFENTAAEYSRFMGAMIDFEKITVARWCSIAVKYDAYCEAANAQNEKKKVTGYGGSNN